MAKNYSGKTNIKPVYDRSKQATAEDFNEIATDIETIELEYTRWLYPYPGSQDAPAANVPKNTMTRLGTWLMVSNELTSDFPFPVKANTPSWNIVPDPTWTTKQNLGDFAFGYDIEATVLFDLSGSRLWSTGIAGVEYTIQLWDINNINNPILIGSESIDDSNPAGWVEILDNDPETNFIVYPGNKYRLAVIVHATVNDSNYDDTWVNIDGGDPTASGVVTLDSTAGIKVLINNTSDGVTGSGTDRSTDLLLLGEGDRILFTESNDPSRFSLYRVAGSSVDQTTHVELPVEVLDQGKSIRNNRAVTTEWVVYGADTNVDYVEGTNLIPNYFPNGSVRGFFTQDITDITSPLLTTNNNIYGTDLRTDEFILSSKWDVMFATES